MVSHKILVVAFSLLAALVVAQDDKKKKDSGTFFKKLPVRLGSDGRPLLFAPKIEMCKSRKCSSVKVSTCIFNCIGSLLTLNTKCTWYCNLPNMLSLSISGKSHGKLGKHHYFLSWREPWNKFEDWDWFNARNFCRERCMDLVSFETAHEFQMFKEVMIAGKDT